MAADASTTRVAFVGLGTMGYPMALQIAQKGFALTVYDINPQAGPKLASEAPCTVVPSLAAAAGGADVLVTMLPSSKEVDAAVLGNEQAPGILSALKPGAVIIDMSSSDPIRTRALAAKVAAAGCTLVDAPVSGSVRRARDGTLAIMFGGSEADFEFCKPVLSCMGTSLFRVGDAGAGHAMKALNNYVSAAGLVAAVEALHVGEKFGIDPHVMTKVLNASTGKNNTTENKVEQFMLSGSYASGFFLKLMAKDVGIAISLADHLGIPATLGHACTQMWQDAAAESTPTTDHTEMYRLLRK